MRMTEEDHAKLVRDRAQAAVDRKANMKTPIKIKKVKKDGIQTKG